VIMTHTNSTSFLKHLLLKHCVENILEVLVIIKSPNEDSSCIIDTFGAIRHLFLAAV